MARSSGILLHPTSFPGPGGIGDLGDEAYRFLEWLEAAGQTLWQTLALGPTGYGDSPYASFSAYAGNPLLISPQRLVEEGDLHPADLSRGPQFPPDRVDFGPLVSHKTQLLRRAAQGFFSGGNGGRHSSFKRFCQAQAHWLDDYALFMAVKAAHQMADWTSWEEGIALRKPPALKHWREKLEEEILCQQYLQYQFFSQWFSLKDFANERNIKIMGDVPIFVAHDSADVWAHPQLFHLDAKGHPRVVAGVPPDYFSETGQRWGNPLYHWDEMEREGYAWWTARVRHAFTTVDILRIDHFRGFEAYWEVPAREPTAEKGRWVKGPGNKLFLAMQKALGPLPIVAEDLGVITPEVIALRDEFNFPGMGILQFAFDQSGGERRFLPHNHIKNMVIYTGTHDNDTTASWFEALPEAVKERIRLYIGGDAEHPGWDFIRLALASVADLAIIPLQDVLELGSEARMNFPGKASGNWQWRYREGDLNQESARCLRALTQVFGRGPAEGSMQ